jgi:hypothetical protein
MYVYYYSLALGVLIEVYKRILCVQNDLQNPINSAQLRFKAPLLLTRTEVKLEKKVLTKVNYR